MKINLNDLQVLALDCQATGANPEKGHLLEIGWVKTCAAATVPPKALPVKAYLASLPQGVEIPPAVQRVTGISIEALEKARSAAGIWRKVIKTAHTIAAANRMDTCPVLIHYARFEMPFLRNLHAENNPRGTFPFCIICTHEIAKRLLPGLPRRGLRAEFDSASQDGIRHPKFRSTGRLAQSHHPAKPDRPYISDEARNSS
jgi:DNA polymerase-3 subunit epsilon